MRVVIAEEVFEADVPVANVAQMQTRAARVQPGTSGGPKRLTVATGREAGHDSACWSAPKWDTLARLCLQTEIQPIA